MDLSRDGFGTIDSSRITVLGNARVDEVKKPFPFAKGILGTIYKEPAKTQYSDFKAPDVSIEEVKLEGERLSVKLTVDAKTTKVELDVDGCLAASFAGDFAQLQCPLDHRIADEAHQLTVYAYDRFLNCGQQTASLSSPGS